MRIPVLVVIIGIIVVLILSGIYFLRDISKEPALDQLTRVDVMDEEYSKFDIIFAGEEEINELVELFQKIDWEDGKAEMSREPDVILNLFFMVEEGMPESIRPYQIWINTDQTATIIDEHDARIGKLKKEHATRLLELVNEKIEQTTS